MVERSGTDDRAAGRRRRDRRRAPALAAASLLLAGTALTGVSAATAVTASASPVACNDFWTNGGGDHDWSTAANWSAGVPTAASDVCLDDTDTAGSYTVKIDTYNPGLVANAITVGGSAGNTVTLSVLGTGGGVQVGNTLTLTDQDAGAGILPTGAVTLGMAEGGGIGQTGAIVVDAGTLVNQGTITSTSTSQSGQNNGIYGGGALDNQGTLAVDQGFNVAVASWTTSGTVDIAAGTELHTSPPSGASGDTVTQAGGTIANAGELYVDSGSTFVAAAGTATGNPIQFDNVTIDPSGTGSGTFHVQSGSAVLGSSIGAGYTLWSSGVPGYTHGLLTTNASVTNFGTLELGSTDGTHGTLDVAAGTFTNAGTLIFENTENGPDSLEGPLVNTRTVLVDDNVEGSGTITNDGTVSVAAGAPISATSYTQGAGGTLALAVSGGPSPTVPELQLTGSATAAGTLAVTTTGTARGTFPVVDAGHVGGRFATTRYSGESYSVAYTSAGVSLTGPAAPARPTPHAGRITGRGGRVRVRVSCPAGGPSCSALTVRAVVVRHLGRSVRRVVVVSTRISLRAGRTRLLDLRLNRTGRQLLRQDHTLVATVTVTASGRTLRRATLRLHG